MIIKFKELTIIMNMFFGGMYHFVFSYAR